MVYLHFFRDFALSFPSVIFIWRFIRRSICHFRQSPLSVVFCHCILSFYCVTLSSAIVAVIYQRHRIRSFAPLMFLCHSLLSSSLGILNLSFTTCSLSLHSVNSCVILLPCAFVVFIWHSICQFAIYNQSVDFCCHFVLSCSSVVLFCRLLRSLSSVIVFCHVVLSCYSVIFFCHLHLAFWSCYLQSGFALDVFLT